MASLPTGSQYLPRQKWTYRVRGVPHDWNRDKLGSFLAENGFVGPAVQSLATEIHRRSQTATVTFQDVPSRLEERLADPAKGFHLYVPSSDQHSRPRSLTLDTAFLGVTTLYTPAPKHHKVDFIAISGLGGHPFGSFKERDGEHMWLRDALPYDVTEKDRDTAHISRVMVYGYSSNLFQSDSFQNLEDLGTAFYQLLRTLAIEGAFKPIVFIAHSLGGLIVKQVFSKEDQQLLRAVYGIAFFGVPHNGMDISSLIPMVQNGPNRFLLESIGLFSSQILSQQHREFMETLKVQEELKIICFYETRMSPTAIKDERGKWKIAGPAAVLVSKSSATQCLGGRTGPQYICAIDRTHSEMVKFGPEDDAYEQARGRIQSLARDALNETLRYSIRQKQACLQSLAFEHMQTRASDINEAISGTCKWLLQHESYKSWIASNYGLLWMRGKPGSGKSTLLKFAFNHHKNLSSTTNNAANSDILLSFFFHDRGEELQKTPFGLFRSLLHQVLKQEPDALSDLVEDFTQKCTDIGNYREKWKWNPNDLWRFLELSLPRVLEVRSVWLFVDALDECGEINAKDLVKKFKLLVKKVTSLSTSGKQLRICFSCRHYPILSSPGLLEVHLERENRGDISTYVWSELSSSGESIPTTIPDLIIDRASGVFLWALLVVKRVVDLELNGYGPKRIEAAVHSIPKDLDDLYDGLIRNMTTASLKLIKWICFATRPLSVSELRWAMAINAGYSSLDACQDAEDYIPDNDRMKKQIVKLSRGLAEVTTGDHMIVQFIHQSVKDFFIGKVSISPNTAIGTSHLELSKVCIQYLAMEEIVQLKSHEEAKLRTDFPFLQYAVSSWVAHLKGSAENDIAPEGVLELLGWPLNNLLDIWIEIYDSVNKYSDEFPAYYTRLEHLAARYNLHGVMNAIMQINVIGVDTKDINNRTPLFLAASQGHDAIVALLLATKQVDINVIDNVAGLTPLSSAAQNGHEAVVKLLLATGQIDFDTGNHENLYSLPLAIENGHEAVVKLLLSTGQFEVDLMDIYGCSPLSLAAGYGHEAMVKSLLATGRVEIDSKDTDGYTPLSVAAKYGHDGVVKLLLATGQVDINSKNKYHQTPLLLAITNENEAVARLLLATGRVEVNSRDNIGYTALLWAAANGHEALVKLLLTTDEVDIDVKDFTNRTSLSLAAGNGHKAVVELLLATSQAKIDSEDRDGRTAPL
ncbi:hypothetical protein J3E68DRAFT_443089, partial [Trichoderma sp. SZMC 28012]